MVGGGGWLWSVQVNSEQVSFKSFAKREIISQHRPGERLGIPPSELLNVGKGSLLELLPLRPDPG